LKSAVAAHFDVQDDDVARTRPHRPQLRHGFGQRDAPTPRLLNGVSYPLFFARGLSSGDEYGSPDRPERPQCLDPGGGGAPVDDLPADHSRSLE
jgi:hypothetical protein